MGINSIGVNLRNQRRFKMKNHEEFVDSVIQSMQDIIVKHRLQLLKHYPDDLLKHDKAFLMEMASPGAHIAWVVGDRHSHIVALGLSKSENEMITCLTRLSSNDKFYSIKFNAEQRVEFKEYTRETFESLCHTEIKYSPSRHEMSDFWLMRGTTQIGHIEVNVAGTFYERVFECRVIPHEGISLLDITALNHWANQAIIKTAGTLFVKSKTSWGEALPKLQAA